MLDDPEKVYAFKSLIDAFAYSGLPFDKRKELAEKWLAEIELQMERNDDVRARSTAKTIARNQWLKQQGS